MKLPRRRFLHLAAGVAALPAVPHVAWAQSYPSQPLRWQCATGCLQVRILVNWPQPVY